MAILRSTLHDSYFHIQKYITTYMSYASKMRPYLYFCSINGDEYINGMFQMTPFHLWKIM